MDESLEILKQQKLAHLSARRKESTAPSHFQGLREFPILSKIIGFNCFENTIVEPMHALFLGETKKYLHHYWNVPKIAHYLSQNVNPLMNKKIQANNRLLSLKVPSSTHDVFEA